MMKQFLPGRKFAFLPFFMLVLSACMNIQDQAPTSPPPPNATTEIVHILNCRDRTSGAINNIFGEPTWVVPGEMALAAVALKIMGYDEEATQACAWLASVQDPADGAWFNQYDHETPTNAGKSPRHTAQALMAFYRCGYQNRTSVENGLSYLRDCIVNSCDPADGCLGGGKDASGAWIGTEWLSDNVYAAKAFEYFGLITEANKIKATIDGEFLNATLGAWYRTKSGPGEPYSMDMGDFGWINFAPANWNLDVVYPADLTQTIKEKLQIANGAFLESANSEKRMPGIGLQAHLASRAAGSDDGFSSFYDWLRNTSGLVQGGLDINGDSGGIVDWIDGNGNQAPWWERFIDTSAFVVFLEYDFMF
jgi:hypothetical protein